MTENEAIHKRVLKRLASLKMVEEEQEPILNKSEAAFPDYLSIQRNGRKVKQAVMENVQNAIKKWRERIALKKESNLRVKRQRQLLNEEQKMRHKLEYHFLTPFEKYKRGRKPWKLAIQILKIIIVTVQVFELIPSVRHSVLMLF